MASTGMGSQSPQSGSQGSSAIEQAKADAGRLTEAARSRTHSFVEERKMRVADSIGGVVEAARSAAQRLDEQGSPHAANYVQRAADGLERFSDSVRNRDFGELMGEAEDFARRQPAVFIGASVAVGFLLARFLRSSSERREAEGYGYGQPAYRGYGDGTASESAFGQRAYQEGMTGSAAPDRTWSEPGSMGSTGRTSQAEGMARQEMREGYTGASRPGGPVGGMGGTGRSGVGGGSDASESAGIGGSGTGGPGVSSGAAGKSGGQGGRGSRGTGGSASSGTRSAAQTAGKKENPDASSS